MAPKALEPCLSVDSPPAAGTGLPAHQAARRILLELFAVLEANRAGVLAGREAEVLHDFRVALRRTRAALGQLREIFPPPELEHFRGEFRWLGGATGPTRDLDVYLQNFPAYQAGLPAACRDDLIPLRDLLLARRREAHRDLVRSLKSRRYRSLVRDWGRFLAAPALPEPAPPKALLPFADLAGRRLRRLFSRVLKAGRKIDAASPPTDRHALRIRCKKLRYLLEFVAALGPARSIERLIGELKILQDNLGDFQDLTVQIRALSGYAAELAAAGAAPRTLTALGMLIEQLERRRESVRGAFAERFAHFARKGNQGRFRKLFPRPGRSV